MSRWTVGAVIAIVATANAGPTRGPDHRFRAKDAATDDLFGYPVVNVGDVDGDGMDDLAVGAGHDDDNGPNSGGAAYVYHGSPAGVDAIPPEST